MKKVIITISFCIGSFLGSCLGQGVGIGTNSPDRSAILDVISTEKGILIPRMDSVQRINIANPANGLMVYDNNKRTICIFNGSNWNCLSGNSSGISCWDTNGNGFNDNLEDLNGDGVFNTLDCQGPGQNGINCWDLNGNRINDSSEDVNGDGTFNALDCSGVNSLPLGQSALTVYTNGNLTLTNSHLNWTNLPNLSVNVVAVANDIFLINVDGACQNLSNSANNGTFADYGLFIDGVLSSPFRRVPIENSNLFVNAVNTYNTFFTIKLTPGNHLIEVKAKKYFSGSSDIIACTDINGSPITGNAALQNKLSIVKIKE